MVCWWLVVIWLNFILVSGKAKGVNGLGLSLKFVFGWVLI